MKRFIYCLLAFGLFSSCNDETDVRPDLGQENIAPAIDFSVIAEKNLQDKPSQEADIEQQMAALNIAVSEIQKVADNKNASLSLSERINRLNHLGSEFLAESNYNFALMYYLISLQLAVDNEDAQKAAVLYRNLALAYQYKGEYQKAAINFWHSLQLWSRLGDHARKMQLYNDLGVVYALVHDFVPVEDFDVDNSYALAFFEAALDGEGVQQSEYNITLLYTTWSNKALITNGRDNDEYLYAQDDVEDDL